MTARVNNEALLAKIAWKILRKEDTVWQPLIQAKYLKERNLLDYCVKPGDSAIWKGIMKCVDLIKPFLRWQVGNASTISFWHDKWLGCGALRDKGVSIVPSEANLRFSQLFTDTGEWNFDHLLSVIPQEIKERIVESQIQLHEETEDLILQNESANGPFSCQSAYKALQRQSSLFSIPNSPVSWVWKSGYSNKLKHFLWLASQDKLATNLLRRTQNLTDSATCPDCAAPEEYVIHTLHDCPATRSIWKNLLRPAQLHRFISTPTQQWLEENSLRNSFISQELPQTEQKWVFVTGVWEIWKARNTWVFRRKNTMLM